MMDDMEIANLQSYRLITTRRSPIEFHSNEIAHEVEQRLLAAAVSAPDHGRLRPWIFITIKGEQREQFGHCLASALQRRQPNADPRVLAREQEKPFRAPLIIVVAVTIRHEGRISSTDQILSAGAAAQNILLAAHALGLGAQWKTGAAAEDKYVKRALGLSDEAIICGFLYVGVPKRMPESTSAPELSNHYRSWPEGDASPHKMGTAAKHYGQQKTTVV